MHGYKGFKDWGFFPYAAGRLAEDFDVVSFNFSHNGVGDQPLEFTELEKFAMNTYSMEQDDIGEVVQHVRGGTLPLIGESGQSSVSGPNTSKLVLLGYSKGGGGAIIYACDHPGQVDAVVSWNGITDVDLFTEEQKRDMTAGGRAYVENARTKQLMPLDRCILDDMEANRSRFAIVERVKSCRVAVGLVQGTEDSRRSREGSERMAQSNPLVRWIRIQGGNHPFGASHPFRGPTESLDEAIAQTRAFLQETLQGNS
jgi:pimeloyl-ACP methyl ester carboxylesterase